MQHERMQKWDVVWDAQVGRSIDAQQAVVLRRRGGGKGVACGKGEGLGGGQAVRWWSAAASRPSHLKNMSQPSVLSNCKRTVVGVLHHVHRVPLGRRLALQAQVNGAAKVQVACAGGGAGRVGLQGRAAHHAAGWGRADGTPPACMPQDPLPSHR